jgi:hypothetical protein
MDEVPGAEPPLLTLDQEQALAREDEEVLLGVLAVIHAARLTRSDDPEGDPDLVEAQILRLEGGVEPELALEPACVPRIEDEPALPSGTEAVLLALERSLGDHGLEDYVTTSKPPSRPP